MFWVTAIKFCMALTPTAFGLYLFSFQYFSLIDQRATARWKL